MPDIILPVLCMRFGEGEEFDLDHLHRQLQTQSIAAPIPIRRPADVLMRSDGTVNDGYKFTPEGLSSLCQRIGPGLSQWLTFLSGVREVVSEAPVVEPNPDLAVRMLNEGIRHCFSDRLAGHRLVVDPGRKSIEGLVGPKYHFLSNLDWLIQCQAFVERTSPDNYEFLGGSLTGRRFLFRYVTRRPWFTHAAEDGSRSIYRRGWSFSNSETGKSSVRVGFLVVDSAGNSSLRSLAKQAHTSGLQKDKGEKLLSKLRSSFENVDVKVFQGDIARLGRQRIPLGNGIDDLRKLARQMNGLMAKRLPRSLARGIISLTLSAVSTRQPAMAGVGGGGSRFTDLTYVPPERSYYHLYHALTTRARQCFPDEQERAEALAYDLLRGRFKPVSSEPKN